MGHWHSAIRQTEGLEYDVKRWNEFVRERQETMDKDVRVVEENEE